MSIPSTRLLVSSAVVLLVINSLCAAALRALAEPLAPTATAQQIIFLDATGKIWADAWQQSTLSVAPVWSSGGSTGWSNIVTGDFNGDGKADIVATKLNPGTGTSSIRAFFPALGIENAVDPVDLPYGWQYHLLAAGPFRHSPGDVTGLVRDQLAATYRYMDGVGVWHDRLLVYAYQNGVWSRFGPVVDWDYRLQDMAAGDVNRDGYADLTLLFFDNRKIQIRSGQDLLQSLLYDPAEDAYCCYWWSAAVGNVDKDNNDTDHPGNEVALLRDSGASNLDNSLLGWYQNLNDIYNVDTLSTFWGEAHAPNFTNLALGDVNGDGDLEMVQIRDPGQPGVYLSIANPSGAGPNPIYEAFGAYDYGQNAWRQVATGDINGDGIAEVVLLRNAQYYAQPTMRVFYRPTGINPPSQDFSGSIWLPGGLAIADLGLISSAPGTTSISITGHTPDPSQVGELVDVSFELTIQVLAPGAPTGAVTVTDGTATCTATLPAGSCSLALQIGGPHFLVASYGGDGTFLPSVSSVVIHNVISPTPALTMLEPPSAMFHGSPFTLILRGAGFVPVSTVRWGGAERPAAFISDTELRANVAASDLRTVRNIPVSVANPAPGGGTSAVLTFAVEGHEVYLPLLRR